MKSRLTSLMLATVLAASPALAQTVMRLPAGHPIAAPAEPDAISLGPSPPGAAPEQWETFGGMRIVRNVTAPTLIPFLPDPSKATGAAVIIAPGGAFTMLSIDMEGYDVARWLADHGVAAFVLKYRLEPSPRDPAAYAAALGALLSGVAQQGPSRAGVHTPAAALADAQAAVRRVRGEAKRWGVDPSRVGFLGFSAGAFTTLSVALADDKASRPDFIAPIYGPMSALSVPADAPPMFNAIAADDPLIPLDDLGVVTSWRAAHRPVEFHLYEHGGHGFGMNRKGTTSDLWIDEFYAWMKDRGLLKPTP
jgi:acetyl esterase/lipase